MLLALSTRWNASRHKSGEAMLDEILSLGISNIELGYDLTIDLVPGVKSMVESGAVNVTSVHNFCPVPMGVSVGHPELFLLASTSKTERERAITYTSRTIELAVQCGASAIVVHSGYVNMGKITPKLIKMANTNEGQSRAFEKNKLKLMVQREKKVKRHMDNLYESLDKLIVLTETSGVKLCLENLPSWEAIPTETEMEAICRKYGHSICYWHDIGHGQVRQNLGFIVQNHWIQKLLDCTAGYHIHDAMPCAYDHLMPPKGQINFERLLPLIPGNKPIVIEPIPGTPAKDIITAVEFLTDMWQKTHPKGDTAL